MFFCWNLFPERYTPKNSSCPGPYGLGMTWQPASAKETLCQGEKHTGTIPWPCGMSWSLRERLQYEQTHTHRYMTLGCPPCDHSMESTAEHTHVLVVVTQICVSPALTPLPTHRMAAWGSSRKLVCGQCPGFSVADIGLRMVF